MDEQIKKTDLKSINELFEKIPFQQQTTLIFCPNLDCLNIHHNRCSLDIVVMDTNLVNGIPRINEFKCRYYRTKGELNE